MFSTTSLLLDPALFPGLIQYYPAYCVLYCRPCTAVVFPSALLQHLQHCYNLFAVVQRRLLVQHCQTLDLIAAAGDLQLPANDSLLLSFLPVYPGYSCSCCSYLTCSRKQVCNHANRIYRLRLQACTNSY